MAKDTSAPSTGRRAARARDEAAAQRGARELGPKPSPRWLVPVAMTLLVLGLLYMVVYYVSAAQYPLPIGDWNLAVGLGLIMLGGALLTNWR